MSEGTSTELSRKSGSNHGPGDFAANDSDDGGMNAPLIPTTTPLPTHHAAYTPYVTNPIDCLNVEPEGRAKDLPRVDTRFSSCTRPFYERQNQDIESFQQMETLRERVRCGIPDDDTTDSRAVKIAVRVSLLLNVLITVVKLVLVIRSHSVSFMASLLDSCLDLISGAILVLTNHMVNKKNLHKYPLGKQTFEPIGTLVFSCSMFVASFQMLQHSAMVLADLDSHNISIELFDLLFMGGIVVTKLLLYLYCNRYREHSSSVDALASDHFNDVISNTFGMGCAVMALKFWLGLDPIAAILITFYIMKTWACTAYEQIMNLSGRSAPREIIQQITWTARNHHPSILFVDTVRAVALGGTGYHAEVDIVLPPEMPLRQAHDIGESLQIVLERSDFISRAYVHLDYEFAHNPWDHR
eukprot:Sspe_Gene.26088::Locus_10658_Transcript_1_1_Confidence_1.000_Length_1400::g.26088::m.26088